MKIRLSVHASERCKRRGISIKKMCEEVAKLPRCHTYVEWMLSSGVTVVVIDDGAERIIVTVYRKRRVRKRVAH